MKRPASSQAASRTKKGRGSSAVATVVAAISSAEKLHAAERAYLVSMLPRALETCKADRPPFESELVAKAGAILSGMQQELEKSLAAAKAKQAKVTDATERTAREATRDSAQKSLDAAIKTLENAKEARAAAQKAVQDAKLNSKTCAKALSVEVRAAEAVAQKKATLQSAFTTEFELLKTEGCMSPVGKKALKHILMLGLEYEFDKSLFQTFPAACQKVDSARTEFEKVVFTDVQAAIEKQLEVLAAKVAASEPTQAEKKEAAEKAETDLQAATASLSAADEHFDKSADAITAIKPGVRAGSAYVRGIWRDMKASCNAADDLAVELQEFTEVVSAFEKLKEKVPEPEVAEVQPSS
jgi:hypothetical protein